MCASLDLVNRLTCVNYWQHWQPIRNFSTRPKSAEMFKLSKRPGLSCCSNIFSKTRHRKQETSKYLQLQPSQSFFHQSLWVDIALTGYSSLWPWSWGSHETSLISDNLSLKFEMLSVLLSLLSVKICQDVLSGCCNVLCLMSICFLFQFCFSIFSQLETVWIDVVSHAHFRQSETMTSTRTYTSAYHWFYACNECNVTHWYIHWFIIIIIIIMIIIIIIIIMIMIIIIILYWYYLHVVCMYCMYHMHYIYRYHCVQLYNIFDVLSKRRKSPELEFRCLHPSNLHQGILISQLQTQVFVVRNHWNSKPLNFEYSKHKIIWQQFWR